MPSESSYHLGLKRIAKEILNDEGYYPIIEEYPVSINKKSYRIDVIGFKHRHDKEKQQTKVIECGNINTDKFYALKDHFDEVRILTLNDVFDFFDGTIPEAEKKTQLYRRAYLQIKEKYEKLEQKWNRLSDMDNDSAKKKTELLQIRCTHKVITSFRTFVINNNFDNHEEGLKDLLTLAKKRRDIINSCEVFIKRDMSVVTKDGIVSKD